jgi:hypothetical protein
LAEAWEYSIPLMPIPEPQSLPELLEQTMQVRNLNAHDLA